MYSQSTTKVSAVRLRIGGDVINSIVFDHPFEGVSSEADKQYSASETSLSGLGNILLHNSPFIGLGVYRINSSSPVYNRAKLSFISQRDSLDLAYQKRLMCESLDMGAYEYQIVRTEILAEPQPLRICEGGDISFKVQAQGESLSYQWQRNGQNILGATLSEYRKSFAGGTDSGDYRVIVYGACCNDTSKWVHLGFDFSPKVFTRDDTIIRTGGDVLLYVKSSVGNVVWYDPNGMVVTDLQLRNIEHSCTYRAEASNGVCLLSVSDEVYIEVQGEACAVEVPNDTSLCPGSAYRLQVLSVQGDYKWVIAGTNQELPKFSIVRPMDTTVYVAVVSNSGGVCRDTLQVNVRKVSFEVRGDAAVCAGNSFSLHSNPGASMWYQQMSNGAKVALGGGNLSAVYPPANAITYYIGEYTDAQACTVEKKVKIYSNPVYFETMEDTNICLGSEIVLSTNTEPSLVLWRDSFGNDLGTEAVLRPQVSGVYYAQTYDAICGVLEDSVYIKVSSVPSFAVLGDSTLCKGSVLDLWSVPNADYWQSSLHGRLPHPYVDAMASDTFVGHYRFEACSRSDTMVLEVVDKSGLLLAMADTTLKKGECVVLQSTPAADLWTVMQSNDTLNNLRICPIRSLYYVSHLHNAYCGNIYDTVFVKMKADTVIVDDTLLRVEINLLRACTEGESMAWAEVSGGQKPYRYYWSTGSEDSLIRYIRHGELCVEVTDKRGNQVSTCIQLDSISPLQMVYRELVNPEDENCETGMIRVDIDGGLPPYEYYWNDVWGDSVLSMARAGSYYLRVVDANACENRFLMELTCMFYDRVLPTLFITPNGDGKNDYLSIENIESYPQNSVVILSSYGEEVANYQGYNNSNIRWDGRNKRGKVLPDGVYYYIIRAEGLQPMVGSLLMKLSKK